MPRAAGPVGFPVPAGIPSVSAAAALARRGSKARDVPGRPEDCGLPGSRGGGGERRGCRGCAAGGPGQRAGLACGAGYRRMVARCLRLVSAI